MAYPKKVNAANIANQDKAIESHVGFVSFVAGKVKKVGLENVLKSEKGGEYYWLKKSLERVLDFAEEVQIKKIPTTLEGSGENGEFKVIVEIAGEIPNENNPAQESGNRISQFIEI